MAKPPETSPYRLFVEGPDDKWSVINLLARHGYDWENVGLVRPFVRDVGGINNLLEPTLVSAALKSFARVGFMLDADLSVLDRWARVRSLLLANDVPLPGKPSQAGAIVNLIDGRRVGVWMMPDNTNPGTLEHFIGQLIAPADPCRQHAHQATTKARALGAGLSEQDHAKGFVYSWLAWQQTPGLPFGTALTAHVLRHDSAEALAFVAWFRNLFGQ